MFLLTMYGRGWGFGPGVPRRTAAGTGMPACSRPGFGAGRSGRTAHGHRVATARQPDDGRKRAAGREAAEDATDRACRRRAECVPLTSLRVAAHVSCADERSHGSRPATTPAASSGRFTWCVPWCWSRRWWRHGGSVGVLARPVAGRRAGWGSALTPAGAGCGRSRARANADDPLEGRCWVGRRAGPNLPGLGPAIHRTPGVAQPR